MRLTAILSAYAFVACSAVAHADVDVTGAWTFSGSPLFGSYVYAIQQVGTSLSLCYYGEAYPSLTITGTIDPQSGALTFALPPPDFVSGQLVCDLQWTAVASGDSMTVDEHYGLTCAPFSPTFGCRDYTCRNVSEHPAMARRVSNSYTCDCGNGIVDKGEQCDDGNSNSGDGCSPFCEIEPCYSCSGSPSVCAPLPADSACDDGNACTVNACDANGTCLVTGTMPQGSACDDGDACTANACDASGNCLVTNPMVLDCDDGNVCTVDSCDPVLGCVHMPDVRSCRSAGATKLLVEGSGSSAADRLRWSWTKGEATSPSDFGTPTGTTAYTLCMFAGTASATLAGARVPGGAPQWRSTSTGFAYKDMRGAVGGVTKIALTGGASGHSKVIVGGKGSGLSFTPPPYETPLTVQLTNDATSACWSSTLEPADVKRNVSGLFSAKSKLP